MSALSKRIAGPLAEAFVTIADTIEVGGKEITVAHPKSADALISEEDFVRDERLPYWADIWPSSIALARHLCSLTTLGAGTRVLELGCGSGLVTCAALALGWEVLATDYYAEALLFTRANGLHNAGREPSTLMVDWRAFPTDLGMFDLVLASDVLYERPYGELIARAIDQSLTPNGHALVADPGRMALGEFHDSCRKMKLTFTKIASSRHEQGVVPQTISIYDVRRAATR